jgi:hypothetical protein
MVTENARQSESSKARVPLSLVAAIAAAGVAIEVIAAVSESRNPFGSLPTVLMYVEAIICLFVVAATIEVGRERKARELFIAGVGITAAALISVGVLGRVIPGGHSSAAFGALYFVWTCAICGVSLLIVAVVRFVAERRKQRSSLIE